LSIQTYRVIEAERELAQLAARPKAREPGFSFAPLWSVAAASGRLAVRDYLVGTVFWVIYGQMPGLRGGCMERVLLYNRL